MRNFGLLKNKFPSPAWLGLLVTLIIFTTRPSSAHSVEQTTVTSSTAPFQQEHPAIAAQLQQLLEPLVVCHIEPITEGYSSALVYRITTNHDERYFVK